MDLERVARIRALAQAPFRPESWREICEALQDLPRGPDLAVLMDELIPRLEAWPVAWRATMCDLPWDVDMVEGRPDPRHGIVRSLRYDRVFIGRYGQIMIRSPRVEGSRMAHANPNLAPLRRITFRGQDRFGDAGALALASSALPHLVALDLGDTSLTSVGIAALMAAPWMAGLEELSLARNADPTMIRSVGGVPLPSVTQLSLGGGALGRDDVPEGAFRGWTSLRHLNLPQVRPTAEGLRALAVALPDLVHLEITDSVLDVAACEALGAWSTLGILKIDGGSSWDSAVSGRVAHADQHLTDPRGLVRGGGLTELSLTFRGIDPAGMSQLAEAPGFGSLTSLTVGGNPIGQDGLDTILRHGVALTTLRASSIGPVVRLSGPALATLTQLDLDGADLGEVRWAGLGPDVASLRLIRCGIGPAGLRALIEGRRRSLVTLDLADNPLGAEGIRILMGCRGLDTLRICRTGLADADPDEVRGALAALGASGVAPERLSLAGAGIDDDTLEALADSPLLRRVTHLSLSDNQIGDRGATALARSAVLANVDRINLSGNQITGPGAYDLGEQTRRGGPWGKVSLRNNPLADGVQDWLDALPPRCCP